MIARITAFAIYIGPLALALLFIAQVARDNPHASLGRGRAVFLILSAYLALLATVTLAPPPISRSNGYSGLNLVPLVYSARCFVPDPGQPSTTAFCLRTILGNVALFIPLGVLVPLTFRKMRSAWGMLAVAVVASILIETLQWVGRFVGNPRWSDVDDLIFNVLGALIGYAIARLLTSGQEIP